jgi:hypothetical protein
MRNPNISAAIERFVISFAAVSRPLNRVSFPRRIGVCERQWSIATMRMGTVSIAIAVSLLLEREVMRAVRLTIKRAGLTSDAPAPEKESRPKT